MNEVLLELNERAVISGGDIKEGIIEEVASGMGLTEWLGSGLGYHEEVVWTSYDMPMVMLDLEHQANCCQPEMAMSLEAPACPTGW